VFAPEAEDLLEEARQAVIAGIAEAEGNPDYENLKRHIRQALGRFIKDRTRRRPMIVPVVMEV
jgi:ribonuclease J